MQPWSERTCQMKKQKYSGGRSWAQCITGSPPNSITDGRFRTYLSLLNSQEGVVKVKVGPFLCFSTVRMPQSSVLPSSARRATDTLCQRAAGARGEAGGTAASRCRLRTGSLCSCVSRRRTRWSGWRPSGRSSLSPWPQRTTAVRNRCYTSSDA